MKTRLQLLILSIFLFGSFNQVSAQLVKDVVKTGVTVKNERAKIFYQLLNRTKAPQIIDIRTPREYAAGHIKDAVLINFYDPNFAKNIEKAGLNKLEPIFIYCRSGNRSGHAIPIFKKLGFRHIVNMVYGINEWNRLMLPVEKGTN